MKIKTIQAMRLNLPPREPKTQPRRDSWWVNDEVANPMSRYPRYKPQRNLWRPDWETVWCKVMLEDGTWGLGATDHGRPVAAVIDESWLEPFFG
jgi:L-rhamnonate dehydratase